MIKIKNKMIVYITLFILGVICGLVLCETMLNKTSKVDDFNIVTTFYPVDLITKNITKDVKNVRITNITKQTGGCVHDYSLTPADMKKIESSDLVIINGMDMEHFIENVQLEKVTIIDSSEGITNQLSNHIWMDLDNYIIQINNILKALCEQDSSNAQLYTQNAQEYIKKIQEVESELQNIEKNDVSIAIMHDSLEYFAASGLFNISAKLYSAHEETASANDIKTFIQTINATNTKSVLIDKETYEENSELVQTVEKETGAKFFVIDLIVEDKENINQYIEEMNSNIQVIKDAVSYGK